MKYMSIMLCTVGTVQGLCGMQVETKARSAEAASAAELLIATQQQQLNQQYDNVRKEYVAYSSLSAEQQAAQLKVYADKIEVALERLETLEKKANKKQLQNITALRTELRGGKIDVNTFDRVAQVRGAANAQAASDSQEADLAVRVRALYAQLRSHLVSFYTVPSELQAQHRESILKEISDTFKEIADLEHDHSCRRNTIYTNMMHFFKRDFADGTAELSSFDTIVTLSSAASIVAREERQRDMKEEAERMRAEARERELKNAADLKAAREKKNSSARIHTAKKVLETSMLGKAAYELYKAKFRYTAGGVAIVGAVRWLFPDKQ